MYPAVGNLCGSDLHSLVGKLVKMDLCLHGVHGDGKIGWLHLIPKYGFHVIPGTVNVDGTALVEGLGRKEGKTLYVVPVEMGEKKVKHLRRRLFFRCRGGKTEYPGPGVEEYDRVVVEAHLHAGGISPGGSEKSGRKMGKKAFS
jgi:hypothetical protein